MTRPRGRPRKVEEKAKSKSREREYRASLERINDLSGYHGGPLHSTLAAYNAAADKLNAIHREVRHVLYGEPQ